MYEYEVGLPTDFSGPDHQRSTNTPPIDNLYYGTMSYGADFFRNSCLNYRPRLERPSSSDLSGEIELFYLNRE